MSGEDQAVQTAESVVAQTLATRSVYTKDMVGKLQADDVSIEFGTDFREKERRSEESIRRVAIYGNPDSRTHNLKLVRGIPTGAPNPGVEEVVLNRVPEVPRPEVSEGPAHQVAAGLDPYQIPLIA